MTIENKLNNSRINVLRAELNANGEHKGKNVIRIKYLHHIIAVFLFDFWNTPAVWLG